jgi:GNAT superfamily N-acetyltransferase
MANDLNDHVGVPGRPFTPERMLAAAFGPTPAFTAIVAELEGTVAGYAAFALGYNTDVAAPSMWLHDLFVAPAARARGVGRALMAALAAETARLDCASLDWGVHAANTGALDFYHGLGAAESEVRIMGLDAAAVRTLVREAAV